MQHVARSGVEFFTASHAFVRVYFLDMFLVVVQVTEIHQTRRAYAITPFDTVHVSQMLQKRYAGFEILAANATHDHLVAGRQVGRVVVFFFHFRRHVFVVF